jgi:hypothetical protein
MSIHFNTYFIIMATCFGYVIAIIRPTQTVELALDAALSGMKHLLFASIIKIYLKAVIKYWYLINCIIKYLLKCINIRRVVLDSV